MLNAVDWTGLFILGGVLVGAFAAGFTTGVNWGDVRRRVQALEAWRDSLPKK